MKYAVVIERAERNYAAYVPNLPGCMATGETLGQAERSIREAILFHIEGLKEDRLSVPKPRTECAYVQA